MPSTLIPELINRSLALTTSSAQVLEANNQRRGLIIQNVGSVNVGISPLGVTAAIGTAGTMVLEPYQAFTAEGASCPKNGFNAIAASGTPGLTVYEIL